MPIEKLLFSDGISSNSTDVYDDRGFHNGTPLIWTNRKVFRLILCAPEKIIANNHERWTLRANEGVGISDGLDVPSGLAPSQALSGDICLAYQGLLRAIFTNATVLNPAAPESKKRPLSEATQQ